MKLSQRLLLGAALAIVAGPMAFLLAQDKAAPPAPPAGQLPKLVDLGSVQCIPCKRMAPILEELKKEYAGRLDVEFFDVWKDPKPGEKYGIKLIPTQIFLDAAGKELFRHEGFFSKENILAKWKELGVDLAGPAAFTRMQPAKPDGRAKDTICYMCDGDINPKTMVTVKTDKGEVRLCSPHCYFILYSCLTEGKDGIQKNVTVTDWATGQGVSALDAAYLYGLGPKGRPTIKAFASNQAALKERGAEGGNVLDYATLQRKELAARCGFCDRAVYPEDAALVKAGGLYTWGCCAHCAMGVAARTGKDIEVYQSDALTGEMIVIKTLDGQVASLEPTTAVAWFGLRQADDGKFVSAGCFHQGFFVSQDNLKKWAQQRPAETGKEITISQSLSDKMKLTPQQIGKACKIGQCAPK